jgi:hypothetical protein
MKALIRGPLLLALLLALGCKSTPATPGGRPPVSRFDEGPGEHIPDLARSLIRERMHLHGDDMNDLLWAVLFLDYDSMKAISEDLASGPKFARPTSNDELNASIPAQFFELQDQLTAGAKRLSESASAKDGGEVAAAFANISETCVRCHSLYLDEPKTEPVLSPEVE